MIHFSQKIFSIFLGGFIWYCYPSWYNRFFLFEQPYEIWFGYANLIPVFGGFVDWIYFAYPWAFFLHFKEQLKLPAHLIPFFALLPSGYLVWVQFHCMSKKRFWWQASFALPISSYGVLLSVWGYIHTPFKQKKDHLWLIASIFIFIASFFAFGSSWLIGEAGLFWIAKLVGRYSLQYSTEILIFASVATLLAFFSRDEGRWSGIKSFGRAILPWLDLRLLAIKTNPQNRLHTVLFWLASSLVLMLALPESATLFSRRKHQNCLLSISGPGGSDGTGVLKKNNCQNSHLTDLYLIDENVRTLLKSQYPDFRISAYLNWENSIHKPQNYESLPNLSIFWWGNQHPSTEKPPYTRARKILNKRKQKNLTTQFYWLNPKSFR